MAQGPLRNNGLCCSLHHIQDNANNHNLNYLHPVQGSEAKNYTQSVHQHVLVNTFNMEGGPPR